MTDALKINVSKRSLSGKEANKKLRRTGVVPCVYYMHGEKPVMLSTNLKEFYHALKTGNQLVDLAIEGVKKPLKAIIKDIQYHPVSDEIIHIDFQGVNLKEEIEVDVRINFTGNVPGVKEGGVLETHLYELAVRCQAGNIPRELTVDISSLQIGDSIHVGDLSFEGVNIISSEEALVVAVSRPSIAAEAEEEAEEGEEGEAEESAETEE